MADANKKADEILKTKLDHFSQAMGIDGMAIRRDFLELAIQSQLEGDPIEIANRFLDYVIGDHLGPRCELLTNRVAPADDSGSSNRH